MEKVKEEPKCIKYDAIPTLRACLSRVKIKSLNQTSINKILLLRRCLTSHLDLYNEHVKALLAEYKVKEDSDGSFDFQGHSKKEILEKKFKEILDIEVKIEPIRFLNQKDLVRVADHLEMEEFDILDKWLSFKF
jgi:hypothetical protein